MGAAYRMPYDEDTSPTLLGANTSDLLGFTQPQAVSPSSIIRKVLIVDDDHLTQYLLKAFVNKLGHRCTLAASGEEALQRFQKEAPDIVLMDLVMPGMGGLEATRRIRQLAGQRWVPIMLIASLSDDDDPSEGLKAGAVDFIYSPVRYTCFVAKFERLLRSLDERQMLDAVKD